MHQTKYDTVRLWSERVGVEPTNPSREIANYKFAGLTDAQPLLQTSCRTDLTTCGLFGRMSEEFACGSSPRARNGLPHIVVGRFCSTRDMFALFSPAVKSDEATCVVFPPHVFHGISTDKEKSVGG